MKRKTYPKEIVMGTKMEFLRIVEMGLVASTVT